MIARKLGGVVLLVVLAASFSGWYFSGVAVDRAALKFERELAAADRAAIDLLAVREAELLALGDMRVERALVAERARKPVETEIINYVTETVIADDCAIDDGGMQLAKSYIDASFGAGD